MEKWFERRFRFDFPVAQWRADLERLRSAPARLERLMQDAPPEALTRRDGGAWSALENAGHLGDLEELVLGRLDDYDAGLAELRPADVDNLKTREAGHNDRDPGEVLAEFRRARGRLVERLERATPDSFGRVARHPRLDQPMRVCDMLYFQAEHDDHHLRRIAELLGAGRAEAER